MPRRRSVVVRRHRFGASLPLPGDSTMRVNNHHFVLLLVVIAATGICMLSTSSPYLWAAPPADKYEDLAQLNFTGGSASGTGVRDKGGFTVVTVEADKTRTKLSVS